MKILLGGFRLVVVIRSFHTCSVLALAGIPSMFAAPDGEPLVICLGRVTSAFWTGHTALAQLDAAGPTALVAAFSVRTPLLVAAAVLLVVVIGLFTPINQ